MSTPFRPRQRFRMRSGSASGLGNGSSLTCLSSLGVAESPVCFANECTLECCECRLHVSELAQSFELLRDQAFELGDFLITPLRPR